MECTIAMKLIRVSMASEITYTISYDIEQPSDLTATTPIYSIFEFWRITRSRSTIP